MSPRESPSGVVSPRSRSDAGSVDRRARRALLEVKQRLLPPRLIVLAMVGWLLFGYPFLAVFSRPDRLFGIPILYVYVFTAWAAFIAVIARLVDSGGRRR
ncbi:MAG: hypothetical protein IPJ17_07475 [Holophagales bacterium]|nr:MAG: hypothetical protein IPJ17_07475 [Holophagales bacterium]